MKCKTCNRPVKHDPQKYEDDFEYPEDQCYSCFEDGVEDAHYHRLERIARQNEY